MAVFMLETLKSFEDDFNVNFYAAFSQLTYATLKSTESTFMHPSFTPVDFNVINTSRRLWHL